jgi:hypothetical protein
MKLRFKTLTDKEYSLNINPYKLQWGKFVVSKFQTEIKDFFKEYWHQHFCYEEFPIFPYGRCSLTGKSYRPLRLDIFNLTKRICVEASHEQHYRQSALYHKTQEDFNDGIYRDVIKSMWCKENKIKLVEIYPDDLPLCKTWLEEQFDIEL